MNVRPPYLRFFTAVAISAAAATLLVTPPAKRPPAVPHATTALSGVAPVGAQVWNPPATRSQTPGQAIPEQAGMVVGIDPETGQLGMPTREQRDELDQAAARDQALLSRSSVGLVEEVRPDGTVHVNLQGRFQEYATVQIGPDGKKTFQCLDDSTGFTNATKIAAPTAPALEER